MEPTTQYEVRLNEHQLKWLKERKNAADDIRQALTVHIGVRAKKKTEPHGYRRAVEESYMKMHRYNVRVWDYQLRWLRSGTVVNGSAEIRQALDAYIVWRNMGARAKVHTALDKKRISKIPFLVRVRPDQIEWLRTAGGNRSKIIREALAMLISWHNDPESSTTEYSAAATGYEPGEYGTKRIEVRLERTQAKWTCCNLYGNGATAKINAAIDIYAAWQHLTPGGTDWW